MMTVASRVGRLAEVRFRPPVTVDELSRFMSAIRDVVDTATRQVVFCTDWRKLPPLSQEVFDTIVWIMRRDNPKIECNGILVTPGNPAFDAQLNDLLRQARNPNRRVFTQQTALLAWLEPRLGADERGRLSTFLAEGH